MLTKRMISIVLALLMSIYFCFPIFAYTKDGTTVEGFDIDSELFRCASANTNGWNLDHNEDGVVSLDEWKSTYGIDLRCEGYDIKDWSALKHFENVHYLWIRDCNNADLSSLSEIGHITFLTLHTDDFNSLSGLDVGTCDIMSVKITSESSVDISKLTAFSMAEHISIQAPGCTNYQEFKKFNAKSISIYVNEKKDIDKFICESITELKISCPELEDISFVKNCPDLYTLDLSDCKVSDPSHIETLDRLKELNLSNNNITDIDWLNKTDSVSRLYLEGNSVDVEELVNSLYKDEAELIGAVGGTIRLNADNGSDILYSCDIIDRDKLAVKSSDESVVRLYDRNFKYVGAESIGTANVEVSYNGKLLKSYDIEVSAHCSGDWNFDAVMTAEDALEILRYSARLYGDDEYANEKGDINNDGVVTADDALEVLKTAAKLN